MARPVLRSYQVRLSASVATPSWTTRFSAEVLRLGLAALFLPQPDQCGFFARHNNPGVGTTQKGATEIAEVAYGCAHENPINGDIATINGNVVAVRSSTTFGDIFTL